ncbi:MAG: hypothetical protein U7123_21490 [Potamolinea sp.]
MTEATRITQNPEATRNYINHLLKQLTVDYQNTAEGNRTYPYPAARGAIFSGSSPIDT